MYGNVYMNKYAPLKSMKIFNVEPKCTAKYVEKSMSLINMHFNMFVKSVFSIVLSTSILLYY